MTEEPKIPQMSEPAGESSPGAMKPEEGSLESAPTEITPSGQKAPGRDAGQVRLTGELTGSLAGKLNPPSEPYPPERRRGVTGQLGAIITGILRGGPAPEGERAKPSKRGRQKPEVDEFVTELRQDLPTEEPGEPRRTGLTGRLIGNLSGSIQRMTGMLGRTEHVDQEPIGKKSQPPLESPESAEGLSTDHAETIQMAQQAGLAEPEDSVVDLGQVEAPAGGPVFPVDEPPSVESMPGQGPLAEPQIPGFAAAEIKPPEQHLPEGDLEQARRTGSMLRRITGPLKRSTDSLGDSEAKRTDTGSIVEATQTGAPSEPYPQERRKSVTGQLGAIITGILRGAPAESEAARTAERVRPQSEVDEYVTELRHDLSTEEAEQPSKPGRTGGLILAIAGSLKIVTGPFGRTGKLFRREKTDQVTQQPAALPLEPIEAEIEQDILAGRLSSTSIAEPPAWVEPEDFVIELGPGEEPEREYPLPPDMSVTEEPAAGLLKMEEPEGGTSIDEVASITLLESGAIAALDQAEEQARQVESGQDWMAEIRQEAADEESPDSLESGGGKHRSATEQLRAFFGGILGRPEETATGPASLEDQVVDLGEGQAEVSDDLVTGRLDRSLGIPVEDQEQPLDYLPGFLIVGGARQLTEDQESLAEEELLPGLESRFEQLSDRDAQVAEQPDTSFEDSSQPAIPFVPIQTDDHPEPQTLTPEDELEIWGRPGIEEVEEGRTIRAEDFWDESQVMEETREASRVLPQDAYAAQYLTGEDTLPELESPQAMETLLHQAYEQQPDRKQTAFEDIRSIVLEDVPEEEWPHPVEEAVAMPDREEVLAKTAVSAYVVEPEPAEGYAAAPVKNWKIWFTSLTLIQKILLGEAIAVGIILLVAIPFFVMNVLLSPAGTRASPNFLTPRALPDNLPYPTGLTLPGGWHFDLNKSTFVEGKWKPTGGEWLEGTELRRVIALPSNPQTEAVVQTFQPGDVIELKLNNDKSIPYKITKVERVPVGETDIFSDMRPSLAIILYQGDPDAQERWVVLGQR